MPKIEEYLDEAGQSSFGRWFESLDPIAAAKTSAALYRLEQGNWSEVKSIGDGVYERRIHFGPGYRIYLAKAGEQLIILLGGGTKRRQRNDITKAKECWRDYKRRKRAEHGTDT